MLPGGDLLDNLSDLGRRRNDFDQFHAGGEFVGQMVDGIGRDAESIDLVEHVGGFFVGVLGAQKGCDLLDVVLICSRPKVENILVWGVMCLAFRADHIRTIETHWADCRFDLFFSSIFFMHPPAATRA